MVADAITSLDYGVGVTRVVGEILESPMTLEDNPSAAELSGNPIPESPWTNITFPIWTISLGTKLFGDDIILQFGLSHEF